MKLLHPLNFFSWNPLLLLVTISFNTLLETSGFLENIPFSSQILLFRASTVIYLVNLIGKCISFDQGKTQDQKIFGSNSLGLSWSGVPVAPTSFRGCRWPLDPKSSNKMWWLVRGEKITFVQKIKWQNVLIIMHRRLFRVTE